MTRQVLVGFDPSKNRLGWAAVDVETGEPVACGTESLDVASGGWLHQQVDRAVGHVATHLANIHAAEVSVVVREEPISRYPKVAKEHGAVCALVDSKCRRQWPWAPMWTLVPAEWRKRIGLPGNAKKRAVMDWALDQLEPTSVRLISVDQDAADALGVAVAGWRQWTEDARTDVAQRNETEGE